jgi:hypothetical protein
LALSIVTCHDFLLLFQMTVIGGERLSGGELKFQLCREAFSIVFFFIICIEHDSWKYEQWTMTFAASSRKTLNPKALHDYRTSSNYRRLENSQIVLLTCLHSKRRFNYPFSDDLNPTLFFHPLTCRRTQRQTKSSPCRRSSSDRQSDETAINVTLAQNFLWSIEKERLLRVS